MIAARSPLHGAGPAWRRRLPRPAAGLCTLLLILCGLAGPAARADVIFNGFGQVVAGSTLGNTGEFPNTPYGADPSFQPESLFALQARADLANQLSATAQIVASGAENRDFQPRFAWAYASYQIDQHWSLKGGRQRMPLYDYSDFLQVGEAYPWIRPPFSVYVVPITNFDGLSLGGDYALGRWDLRGKLLYGGYQGTAYYRQMTLKVDASNMVGAVLEATYAEWLSLRLSYFQANGTLHDDQVDPLVATLQAIGNTAVAGEVAAENDQARFLGAGFSVNRKHLLVGGEIMRVAIDNSFLPANRGYYLVAGYRLGRLMPLLTYGHAENKFSNPWILDAVSPSPPPAVPPPTGPGDPNLPAYLLYQAYAGVSQLISSGHTIDDYYEAGARYDLGRNTAIKLDFTRYLSGVPGTHGSNLLSAAFTFNF